MNPDVRLRPAQPEAGVLFERLTTMEQCFHVLALDRCTKRILVERSGSQWHLPVFSARERTRVGPLATRFATAHGSGADVLGQWLGRLSMPFNFVDWLLVVQMHDVGSEHRDQGWAPIGSLRSEQAIVDYQRWAIENLGGADVSPSVPGPFGRIEWFDDAIEWVEENAGRVARDEVVPFRVTPHSVVMRLSTAAGRVYFKGYTPASTDEALLTVELAGRLPQSFARTRALRSGPRGATWWLADECPGVPLTTRSTLPTVAFVARELGRLQRNLSKATSSLLSRVALQEAVEWSIQLLGLAAEASHIEQSRERLLQVYSHVVAAVAPETFVPLDLDPGNVLVEREDVRFIDLDESYWGPAPLAAATLARRTARLLAVKGETVRQTVYSSYEQGLGVRPWTEAVWRSFELMSIVLEAQAGWARVSRNVARGELHAPLDWIERRIGERLLRAFARTDVTSRAI